MTNPYITTFSGRKFHYLDPQPDDTCIEDIAHHLSMQCRFTGACRKSYNTAEHSVRVSQLCDTPDMLEGLMHDASEAYLNDINRVLKHELGIMEKYIELEKRIEAFIYTQFNIVPRQPSSVKCADTLVVGIEARDLMHPSILVNPDWASRIDPIRDHPMDLTIPWSQERAEREFLIRYYQLTYNGASRQQSKEQISQTIKGATK